MILGDDNAVPKIQFMMYAAGNAGEDAGTPVQRMNLTTMGLAIGADNAAAGLHVRPTTSAAIRLNQSSPGGDVPEIQMESGNAGTYLNLKAAGAMTSDYTLTFPSGPGTANQLLQTDGAGNLSWATASGDDLGDHTAIQNLNLNGYQLVSQGSDGISISSIGNVGIGQTVPTERLVVKTANNNDGISIDNIAGNNSYIRFWEENSTVRGSIMVRNDNTSGMNIESKQIIFNSGSIGAERMRITSGGAVGIGTTSPASGALLDVNGSIRIGGGSPGAGKVLTSDANGLASWSTMANLTGQTTSNNTILGQNSGTNITTGISNTFIGQGSGFTNISGGSNTFVGNSAGYSTTGNNNTFIGSNAGGNTTTGSGNIALGAFAGQGTMTGSYNIIIGELAGNAISNGGNNIFIGNGAGTASRSARNQIAIGPNALQSLDFNNAGAIWDADNVAIGSASLIALAPTTVTDGKGNTAVGTHTLASLNPGANNTALGYYAGQNITSGNGNVVIGNYAGPATSGIKNNSLYIHNTASDFPLIGGDFAAGTVVINGSMTYAADGSSLFISSDNFGVNPNGRSYLKMRADISGPATSRTVTLGNGINPGQILVIEGLSDAEPVEIADNAAANNTNVSIARVLGGADTITLLWNGVDWIELSYSNN